uniref:Ku domain-containing protein n=1 Tax=Meloidogyne incognita TaxID=6306 RepID=A0A914MUG2_MELIC
MEWEQQEGEENLIYDGGNKAKLFVVDYGEHMFLEGEWRFRLALKAVRDQINKICCMGDLSELCSVIFVNTSNSNNTHKIDCIFTDKELGVTDAEYVKKLDEIINCDNLKEFLLPKLGDSGMSNWAELFFLCQSMLTHSGKVLRKKVITIVTTDKEQIDEEIQQSCKKRICLDIKFIGTEIKVLLIENKIEENEATQFWGNLQQFLWILKQMKVCISKNQNLILNNQNILYFIYIRIFLCFSIKILIKFWFIYSISRNQNLITRICFSEFFYYFRVECRTHYLPKEDLEGNSTKDGEEENNGEIQEYLNNENFEGEINFSKNVGGVNVVLGREELEKLRRFDRPGITVIGFKPLHLLKPSHRMSPAKFIYPLDDLVSGSSVLYRALLKQCLERNLFILVRYTQKPNTTPQICALVPQSMGEGNEGNNSLSEHLYEGFHLLELPFTEEARDLRAFDRYKPPPIPASVICSSENIKEQQILAAEEFVDKLTTRFEPDQFFNPMLQRHYKTVESVALDLDVENFAEEAEKLDKIHGAKSEAPKY